MTRARDIAAVFSTGVSTTELGYLDGVSSAIQTQINTKAADASQGIYLITPSSIANSGGTATLTGGTVTFTGVNSVSLNNCFSATYDNYRILINTLPSANVEGTMRLRVGGTDNSTANSYVIQRLTVGSTTVTGLRFAAADNWSAYQHQTVRYNQHIMEVARPFIVGSTAIQGLTTATESSAYMALYFGTHNQSVSYDGFTLFAGGAATMDGTMSVYGYRK